MTCTHAHFVPLRFPPSQRTIATSITTTANYVGQAVGFFWGPTAVPTHFNASAVPHHLVHTNTTLQQLHTVYYIQAAICSVLFVTIFLYFPDAAPTPPSRSAAADKESKEVAKSANTNFLAGFRELLYHKQCWVLFLSFGIPLGWFSGWVVALDLNLKKLGINQSNAGYIGTVQILAGCVVGVFVGSVTDTIGKRLMKPLIIAMYLLASVSFLWFTLMCARIIPFSLPMVYVSSVIGGMLLNGTIPLFYELCVETAYPIPAGSAAGFLVLVQNLIQTLFLCVPINSWGTSWMNWSLVALIPTFAAFMGYYRPTFKRSELDENI